MREAILKLFDRIRGKLDLLQREVGGCMCLYTSEAVDLPSPEFLILSEAQNPQGGDVILYCMIQAR
jgi:hypothetical protein